VLREIESTGLGTGARAKLARLRFVAIGSGIQQVYGASCAGVPPGAEWSDRRRWGRLEVRLPVAPEAPSLARAALDDIAGDVAPGTLQDARLLASELVTNSVRHAGLTNSDVITFRVAQRDHCVRIEVENAGTAFEVPDREQWGEPVGTGWGLHLVARVADRWGVDGDTQTHTIVWFELRDRT
jgi:anti-sigma regulatory factor (Ser/Thr protein kinase)